MIRDNKLKTTNHFLHIVMMCLTGGAWVIPYILFFLGNLSHNRRVRLEREESSYKYMVDVQNERDKERQAK